MDIDNMIYRPENFPSELQYLCKAVEEDEIDYPKYKIATEFHTYTRVQRLNVGHPAFNENENSYYGLFCIKQIPANYTIGTYAGVRKKTYDNNYSNYIMSISDTDDIDAENAGNEARFINDYKNLSEYYNNNIYEAPNITFENVKKKKRVKIISIRDIFPGEEICASYGDEWWQNKKNRYKDECDFEEKLINNSKSQYYKKRISQNNKLIQKRTRSTNSTYKLESGCLIRCLDYFVSKVKKDGWIEAIGSQSCTYLTVEQWLTDHVMQICTSGKDKMFGSLGAEISLDHLIDETKVYMPGNNVPIPLVTINTSASELMDKNDIITEKAETKPDNKRLPKSNNEEDKKRKLTPRKSNKPIQKQESDSDNDYFGSNFNSLVDDVDMREINNIELYQSTEDIANTTSDISLNVHNEDINKSEPNPPLNCEANQNSNTLTTIETVKIDEDFDKNLKLSSKFNMLSIEDKKIILENRNIFLLIKNLLIETNSSDELRDQNNKMRKFSEQLLKEIVEIHSLRDENVKLKVANFELQQQLLEVSESN